MKRAEKYHIFKKLKNSDSLCFQWVSEFLFSTTVKDGIITPPPILVKLYFVGQELQPLLSLPYLTFQRADEAGWPMTADSFLVTPGMLEENTGQTVSCSAAGCEPREFDS